MASRLKSLHCRLVLFGAVLVLPSTIAAWALDPSPADAPATPPGNVLPATGGPAEPTATPKDKAAPVAPASGTQYKDDSTVKVVPFKATPVEIPVIKPIDINADRDTDIGRKVAEIMENDHYLQQAITQEMSQRWLKNYFDALDYNHLSFLQSDIDEFTAKYGNNLGDLLIRGPSSDAAVAPAFEIYNRYVQRLRENVVLAEKLLHEKYDFTKDETFVIHNHKSPWIQDAAASEAMWRGQVKSDLLNGLLDKKKPEETIDHLAKRYVSVLRDYAEEDNMDVLEQYLSALTHAYDPHSDYMQPDEAQNFNMMAIDHEVTGIGAVLRSDDGYATIEEIITGGPADLDKRLQPGDKIIAVGQGTSEPVDTVNMKLNRVVDLIRGRSGSVVRLIVIPAGSANTTIQKEIKITRDKVSLKDRLAKAHIIEHKLPNGTIEKFGVIDLHDFYNDTAVHIAKLVERLKQEQVAGIILDLRSNGGGLLDQAVDLTGLFVSKEPVVQIRRYDGMVDKLTTDDSSKNSKIYDGPLMVMVNKMSASATEITAAALQDYGRAIIVGDQSTHGKGTVQTLIPLEQQMPIGFSGDPGNLKMTVQKFYRVAGGSTQKKGVIPDIVLPSVLDALELGETTLPYYLDYDEVPPVPFRYLDLVSPYISELKSKSSVRVAASPDFNYVRQDIAYFKKKIDDSTVSLSEAARLKEQSDLKDQKTAREKDLLARHAIRDKELDLTLDMVDQNLPAAPPSDKKPKTSLAEDDSDADPELSDAVNNAKDDPQLDEAVNIMTDYTKILQDSGSKLVQTTSSSSLKP